MPLEAAIAPGTNRVPAVAHVLTRLQPRVLAIRRRRVTSKRLREQVRRNRNRFPDDFMFQPTIEEAEMVVPQNAAPSPRSLLGGHLPFVFAQEGIAMLSGVLGSPRAVRANIVPGIIGMN
ncbi:MAG: ORF6N domain-containing protein [Elusimicrobia bacterium]|nr:ORF6N domain-containing protein [Elusimicrobiota bacterium]